MAHPHAKASSLPQSVATVERSKIATSCVGAGHAMTQTMCTWMLLFAVAAGCSSRPEDEPIPPIENTGDATLSVCAVAGATRDYAASCTPATVETLVRATNVEAQDAVSAYCADKTFGTFVLARVSTEPVDKRSLYFCKGGKQAELFTFGERYAYAIVVAKGDVVEPLGVTAGERSYDYRCRTQQQISTVGGLPRGKYLCEGYTILSTSPVPVVSHDGHVLAMVAIPPARR